VYITTVSDVTPSVLGGL